MLPRLKAPFIAVLSAAGLFFVLLSAVPPARAQLRQLPTLGTIRAVHTLSASEAVRGYPVHVTGILTYFDPFLNSPRRPILMLTDATGSIYVGLEDLIAPVPLRAGQRLEVTGISSPGDFAPTIDRARIRVVGEPGLPRSAPPATLNGLLTGSTDCVWAEMAGVVRAVEHSGQNVTLKLALRDGDIAATTVLEPGVDYDRLLDARVRIRGIAGSLFNRHRQIIGVQLLFPRMAAVQVVEPAPRDPFHLPVTAVRDLMRYTPGEVFRHRVRTQGIVTLFWPGRLLCLQEGSHSLCTGTVQTTPAVPGQKVDVVGFPAIGDVTPTLEDASFVTHPDTLPAVVAPLPPDEALSDGHDAQLVRIEGTLIAHDKAAQDPTLVMSAGSVTFRVVLPRSASSRALAALPEGSLLSVTGICSIEADSRVFTRHDGYPVANSSQIMLRAAGDVIVLRKPSWWSAEHTLRILELAFAVTLAVLGWVIVLRHRVKQQTALLQYQATHDGLTGMWNRIAVLDLLHREFLLAARSGGCVGLIMLDADHFKQVNDRYGHPAGDAVLVELAIRIESNIRAGDLTGRYGGEEFLIVLPTCTLADIEGCAERVRAAVAAHPIPAAGASLNITVSLGTAILDPHWHTEKDGLAIADHALYRAKHLGRNQVVLGDMAPAARHQLDLPPPAFPPPAGSSRNLAWRQDL